jgi:iron-sulfur cluster repair protein YtfE (RIC family)
MGLQNLVQDLHLHIYLESHLLFPRAIALESPVA